MMVVLVQKRNALTKCLLAFWLYFLSIKKTVFAGGVCNKSLPKRREIWRVITLVVLNLLNAVDS